MLRWFGRLVGLAVAGVVAVGVALLVGVAAHPSVQVDPPPGDVVTVDAAGVARVLGTLIAIPTVSHDGGTRGGESGGTAPPDDAAFAALRAVLETEFPEVHAQLKRRLVAGNTLIYTWKGADLTLPPGVLMAHQDVVPADAEGWSVPPFEGRVADGFVWGRGALDDKNNLVAELAAVELLLQRGFRPTRTVHLVFGHDEEAGGSGAKAAAEALTAKEEIGWVLDEGGMMLHGAIDGLDAPAALVGVAEKGYATVELVVRGQGGHSSMPPDSTAAGRLSAAVVRLEADPLPSRLEGPGAAVLDALGPEMQFPRRLVMTNRWLLWPFVQAIMSDKPSSNASIRTTAAVTMLSAGTKENVLPREAIATVNYRILPGDSIDEVLAHVREAVADDGVEVRLRGASNEASPVSRTDASAWDAVASTIRQQFPGVVVAPFLTVGATDSRWFAAACENVYRFSPTRYEVEDLDRLHGIDERVSVDALGDAVAFYVQLLQNAAGPPGPARD